MKRSAKRCCDPPGKLHSLWENCRKLSKWGCFLCFNTGALRAHISWNSEDIGKLQKHKGMYSWSRFQKWGSLIRFQTSILTAHSMLHPYREALLTMEKLHVEICGGLLQGLATPHVWHLWVSLLVFVVAPAPESIKICIIPRATLFSLFSKTFVERLSL